MTGPGVSGDGPVDPRWLGFEAAARVADRFAAEVDPPETDPPVGGAAERLRRELAGWGADELLALRPVVEAVVAAARLALDAAATSGPSRLGLEIECPAGSSAKGELFLHNVGLRAAPAPIVLHVGEVRSADGRVLDADIVIDPPVLPTLAVDTTAELTVVVEVDAQAEPGTYHGLVVASGADVRPIHLAVLVGPAGEPDR